LSPTIEIASTDKVAMDKAQLILYGVATYLAIKSLVSLMSEHRQNYKKKLAEELKAAVPAAAPSVAPTDKKTPVPAKQKSAAATLQQPANQKTTAKSPVNPAAKAEAVKKAG
jgi:hypothetical protein